MTMFEIPGYTLTQEIQVGGQTAICRGYRQCDRRPVIVKLITSDYPDLQQIYNLEKEYEITQRIDSPGVVKVWEKVADRRGIPSLIFEDFGGISLKRFLRDRPLPLGEFLQIGIQIAQTLGELHHHQIIHKDIKPSNLIINPETRQVKITDFSIAIAVSKETVRVSNPNTEQGTLAYISPEQTGRMNRALDYRTDLYSTGVSFYEMLLGQLPFTATDPMSWIHCHIAKQPQSPRELNPQIPAPLSDIVLKLLAKTPEARYQSAWGLKADLETCWEQLQSGGTIAPFVLGQYDSYDRFEIPQKLYGRDRQIAILTTAFHRIREGTPHLVQVAGYSGIGKSALVAELHKPIVEARGYFIQGKYDPYKRNIPYFAFAKAFQELIRQLFTESEELIQVWKQKILSQIGMNGAAIIEVIPDLELLIGEQPPLPKLPAKEAQQRFHLVFQAFLSVFAQPEHPLVIFLDDLQWADSASLTLIQMLVSQSDRRDLLLIGAYRDNEVSATHPLAIALQKIDPTRLTRIQLQPLAVEDITTLLSDTLNCAPESAQPLATILAQKTQGNPFFLTQLLHSLYEENLLTPTSPTRPGKTAQWTWDMQQIQNQGLRENVIDLTLENIDKLSPQTQTLLKLAACIGTQFDLDLLARANEQPLSATIAQLELGIQSGLILPLSNGYNLPVSALLYPEGKTDANGIFSQNNWKEFAGNMGYQFVHDRVHQAVYELIYPRDKTELHWKLGQLLREETPPEERDEKIFEIVNHLNLGVGLITERSQREELARLNLIAGQKAKATSAYESAVDYLTAGLNLLPENSWETHYDLTLSLAIETVESRYLTTNFEAAEPLAEEVLNRAKTILEKVIVYEIKIQHFISQNKLASAMDTGLQVLSILGISLPKTPSCLQRWMLKFHTQFRTRNRALEDLKARPTMTDPHQLAAMRILMQICAPAYNVNPALLPILVLTMVNLAMKYGNSPFAAYAYGIYGLILSGNEENVEAGYAFGELSLTLLKRFNARELECRVLKMFNSHVRFWKEHLRATIPDLLETVRVGLETGELEYGGYGAAEYCIHLFFVGENLSELATTFEEYSELIAKIKQDFSLDYINIWRQAVLQLRDRPGEVTALVGECFDEGEMLPRFQRDNLGLFLFCVYLAKTIVCYLYGEFEAALENAKQAEQYKDRGRGLMKFPLHHVYYSLALLAQYPQLSKAQRHQAIAQVTENQKKLKKWANSAPENFLHQYELVEAEKARVLNQPLRAIAAYENAIKQARETGYLREEAIANQRAAEFYLDRGTETVGYTYLKEAHYAYRRWGATGIIEALESRYPQVLSRQRTTGNQSELMSTKTSSSGAMESLDLSAVLKASQAIGSEIVLNQLLETLIAIAMENAGATKSCLILAEAGTLFVEATGTVEPAEIRVGDRTRVDAVEHLPRSLIQYVARTQENVVLDRAAKEGLFTNDPYLQTYNIPSVLCMPIVAKGKAIGILYLENNLAPGAFTPDRVEVLKLLSAQAAISLENARLYGNLSASERRLRRQSRALLKLAKRNNQNMDFGLVMKEITEAGANTLEVERVGVWLYAQERSRLECIDGYERTPHRHTSGMELLARDYPVYFRVLSSERILASENARQDPRTLEFLDGYLMPFGITSMLEAPIRLGGQMVGVLCHEHTGEPRQWAIEEQNFAGSLADLVALAIERDRRAKAEQERDRFFSVSLDLLCVLGFDGYFQQLNPAWEKTLSFSIEELKKTPFLDLLHPEDVQPTLDVVGDLKSGKNLISFANRYRCANGSYRWLLWNATAFPEQQLIYAGAHDITKLKQAEEALQKANEELEMRVEERTVELKDAIDSLRDTNAQLHDEIAVRKRTEEALRRSKAQLKQQTEELQTALDKLQLTQMQLVQNEKMASLGQLVAGIAHEINNPVSFIYSNIEPARQYIEDLLHLLALYQEECSPPSATIQDEEMAIELEFLKEDLPKLLQSMKQGADRIRKIVVSLRNFSRLDEAEKKWIDIRQGIESTLLILQHRFNGIDVIKDFADIPQIECYSAQLNQVFMNILSNAIDAVESSVTGHSSSVTNSNDKGQMTNDNGQMTNDNGQKTIRIRTETLEEAIAIYIADNGPGIPEEIKPRIFDPFFTTKAVGKGTGLGLSVSYQIVVEKHGGDLQCSSQPGRGSEFIIRLPLQIRK